MFDLMNLYLTLNIEHRLLNDEGWSPVRSVIFFICQTAPNAPILNLLQSLKTKSISLFV